MKLLAALLLPVLFFGQSTVSQTGNTGNGVQFPGGGSSGGGGNPNVKVTFSNVASTTMTLTGVSDKAVVACWDTSVSPAALFIPDSVVATDSNTLTIGFKPNATGYCVGSTGSGLQGATGAAGLSGAFSALTGGTNSTAAMIVGTGASLSTSGSGTISATPAGSTTQIQYNNAGAFGANGALTADALVLGIGTVPSVPPSNTVLIGPGAGPNITGAANTIIGSFSGSAITSGIDNTFIGRGAGNTSTGDDNTIIGDRAGLTLGSGNANTIIGQAAMNGNGVDTGSENVMIGSDVAFSSNGVTGSDNTCVGFNACDQVTAGQNTIIGAYAGTAITGGIGNVMIGYQAGHNATGSNHLYIDNSSTATPLIGGDFSARTLAWASNQTVPMLTSALPTCASGTWGTRAAVTDAAVPVVGVALTGGGAVFATVHCSKTTSTYFVDGL